MSDEVFSTILAYTKSPKVTKRTTFQDELIKAITARSARQRSSEYSDDFDSDEIVSLGDFSDTSVDENSNKKKMNDFHISDDDENNSPKLSFMKTKKSNSDIMKDEPVFSTKNDEEMAPDGCGNMVGTPLSESQNNDQEIEKDKIRMKPKPRILPVKSMSSENNSSPEANNHIKPSPRPRSMLKKHSHGEEKDGLGEGESPALREELEARSAPSPLPKLNNRQLEAEKKLASENLDPKDPWLTSLSSSSLKENLGDSFSPESGGKASVEDQNEELTENHNSLKSNENEENSFLIDFVTTPIEKSQESHVITDDLEEEKEKAELIMNDLTVDPLCKSQSILISTDTTESSKKTIEDRNMKNKKSTNNRVSSASGRLMTPEFLKKSSSVRRPPSTTTSPHYLGTLKVLDQKPSQKQNIEPERADSIRAAVYQEWLEKKNVYLHEMHRIKRIESENLRIQNEQKRAAKREEALASFEAWKAMKEKEAKKIAAQRRLEEKNKKKTEEENAARKGEALQAFERWKEKKMEYLREKNKKEREYERAKKQKEEETIAEKRKDNLTAVEKWNERKDAFFKEKEKEKINEKRREDLKRAEKKDKDKQAIDEYEKWLEKKERQERIERKQKKRHSFLENEALPPWSPPSRTVFSKKTIEDRNMKNKKSTNNRVSSASGRLMTPEFLKKSSSVRRPPSTTTSPHYLGTLKVLDQKPSQKQNIEPERADSIRAAVYQEWLEKKNVYLHEMHRIKTIESENLRIQNEQKRAAKREEALASFEAWKAMKEKEAKKIAAQRRLEEKNKKKTEEENAARKGEALQAFEQWKEKKMEYLREKNKKEREYERAKKQKEEETIAEKRKDNLTAVEKWNERKDAFFKENEKVKINEKRRELKRAEKKDKDKEAIDEYEKCLEKKERQERIERKQKKRHSFLENEALPPWSPPSRTKTIEDRNMKNKKSTNNRVSSASGRLMTPEFLKKSSSVRRPPSTTTSPHYLGTLKVLDQKPSQKQNIEPERADSIRAAVYQEWLEKKNVYLHEMHRIKTIESENLRIQNEQKRAAKREEALASFEAWKAMKEKEAKKIAAQRRLEEKNKKKTEEENAARKGEALQAFEQWKEKKMEYLREKNKKEREYERAKKQKEEETIAEKRKDNLTAVEKWNERKDAFFKENEKVKINEKRRELKRAEKKDKDKQALDEYGKCLEKKERQERIERKQKKRHSFLENEALPPWSPPSRTVFSRVF